MSKLSLAVLNTVGATANLALYAAEEPSWLSVLHGFVVILCSMAAVLNFSAWWKEEQVHSDVAAARLLITVVVLNFGVALWCAYGLFHPKHAVLSMFDMVFMGLNLYFAAGNFKVWCKNR
jgi:hypothetical protein